MTQSNQLEDILWRIDIIESRLGMKQCACCEFPNNHTPEEFAKMERRIRETRKGTTLEKPFF